MKRLSHPHLALRFFLSLRERIEVRALWRLSLIAACFICLAAGCETTNYAPPVTPAMTKSSPRAKRNVDISKLERGRMLLVHRCIECHTLPPLWKYSRQDWPQIIDSMSHRASLKRADRDAVIAYIIAVRSLKE
jgi:uncharacterized membrane protein